MSEQGMTKQLPSPLRMVTALAGVIALFLNFAYDYSPYKALSDGIWILGGPAFLTIFITAGYLRSNSGNGLSSLERAAGYTLGILGWAVVALPWVMSPFGGDLAYDLSNIDMGIGAVGFFAGPVILIGGIWLVNRARKLANPADAPPVLLMRVVFVANAIECLGAYSEDLQVGAILVTFVTLVYLSVIWGAVRQVRQ